MTKLFLTTTAALAVLPTALQAQGDIVVTATRTEQNSTQVGQSITMITASMLETRQTTVLSDILSTTPGVTVARNGGVGSASSVFIRGADSSHTLIVIDGVRVNDPSTPAGTYDFGNLLSGNIQRVEVLRGADSVPWGSSAIGGVINITTFAPTQHLSGGFNAEGGSYATKSLTGHLSGTVGPVSASLGGGWYETGGISAFAKSEGGKEADGFTQHFMNGRAALKLSNALSIDLRGRYAHSKVNIDGFPAPCFCVFGDTSEYSTTRELSGYAGLNARLFDGRFTTHLGYSISDTKRATFDPTQPAAFQLEFGYKGRTERIEYQGDFKIIDQARLAFGAEQERSSLNGGGTIYRTGYTGAYGQLIASPLPQLTITGGVRYDNHKIYGGKATFAANTAWRVTPTTTLRANYAEGFRAPSLSEIYGDGGVFTLTNLNLKPVTATSYDFGVEQSALGGAVRVTVTYYNRHTRNLIQYQSAADILCSNGFAFSCGINKNIARANAEGVEAALILQPVKELTVAFNYTHGKSYDAGTGLRLLRRPDDNIALNVDWDAGRIKLGSTLQYVGSSFDTDSNTFARVKLQSYVIAGVRAAMPINAHLELYGRIDNLFDEQYQVVKHYGTLGRAAYAGVRVKI